MPRNLFSMLGRTWDDFGQIDDGGIGYAGVQLGQIGGRWGDIIPGAGFVGRLGGILDGGSDWNRQFQQNLGVFERADNVGDYLNAAGQFASEFGGMNSVLMGRAGFGVPGAYQQQHNLIQATIAGGQRGNVQHSGAGAGFFGGLFGAIGGLFGGATSGIGGFLGDLFGGAGSRDYERYGLGNPEFGRAALQSSNISWPAGWEDIREEYTERESPPIVSRVARSGGNALTYPFRAIRSMFDGDRTTGIFNPGGGNQQDRQEYLGDTFRSMHRQGRDDLIVGFLAHNINNPAMFALAQDYTQIPAEQLLAAANQVRSNAQGAGTGTGTGQSTNPAAGLTAGEATLLASLAAAYEAAPEAQQTALGTDFNAVSRVLMRDGDQLTADYLNRNTEQHAQLTQLAETLNVELPNAPAAPQRDTGREV